MNDSTGRIREIEKELDIVFWDLLVPLRDRKIVDPALFERFCSRLDEIIELVLKDPEARKRIVSFLYLVYEIFLAEARLAPDPALIRGEATKLQARLEKLWEKI